MADQVSDPDLDELRALIGHYVRHEGVICQIIEVLEDGPALVLRCVDRRRTVIQANHLGEATRRAPQTYTVPVRTPDGQDLNPAFRDLDIVDPP